MTVTQVSQTSTTFFKKDFSSGINPRWTDSFNWIIFKSDNQNRLIFKFATYNGGGLTNKRFEFVYFIRWNVFDWLLWKNHSTADFMKKRRWHRIYYRLNWQMRQVFFLRRGFLIWLKCFFVIILPSNHMTVDLDILWFSGRIPIKQACISAKLGFFFHFVNVFVKINLIPT